MERINNKIGRFKVSKEVLEKAELERLSKIFAKMIITDARRDPVSECILYTAKSELFRELGESEAPPLYIINTETMYADNKMQDILVSAIEMVR